MQPISNYSILEEFIRLLLLGPPGSGKSTVICQLPSAYVIDVDVNLGGPLRFCQAHGLSVPIGYDRLDIDENGKEVPPLLRYTRFQKLFMEAYANPEIKTIVIDSATGFTDTLMTEVKRQQPSLKDGRQIFQFFLMAGREFLGKTAQIRKNFVMTAHEKIEQDAMTQITQYRVAWPGQLGDYIGAFFTNVWRCEVEREGIPPKYKYQIRTMQDTQHYGLKNDLELPPTFNFDWNLIQSKLTPTK
jgi:AAA domain